MARDGSDVTIVSYSRGMAYALDAATRLAEEGIEADVIDLRTLRPLDLETVVASVKPTQPHRHGRGRLADLFDWLCILYPRGP